MLSFLFFGKDSHAQSTHLIYASADSRGQEVRVVKVEGFIQGVDFRVAKNEEWSETKIIDSDITQEYLKLIVLPQRDTVEVFLDIYFEKMVLQNGKGAKRTFWLKDTQVSN